MNIENVKRMINYFRHGCEGVTMGLDMHRWLDSNGKTVSGCMAAHCARVAMEISPKQFYYKINLGFFDRMIPDYARAFLEITSDEALELFQGFPDFETQFCRAVTMADCADMLEMMLETGTVRWAGLKRWKENQDQKRMYAEAARIANAKFVAREAEVEKLRLIAANPPPLGPEDPEDADEGEDEREAARVPVLT